MSGFFVMRRGWLDNEMFQTSKREPFDHRSAWIWLIERAAYRAEMVLYRGKSHKIERGQIVSSLLDMGGAWGWNTTKVARFITALRERGLIVTNGVTAATVVTICFYDEYQTSKDDAVTDGEVRPSLTVKCDRYGDKQEKELNNSEAKASSALDVRARETAQAMAETWRDVCGGALPVPARLDARRVGICDARWRDSFGRDFGNWTAYCQAIRASPFCCGDNERGWRADFDWALKPKTIQGVQEGKYERRTPARKQSATDNLIEGFGRAAGLGPPDSEPDWSASGPLLDGKYVHFDA